MKKLTAKLAKIYAKVAMVLKSVFISVFALANQHHPRYFMDNMGNPFNHNNLWQKKFHADLADKADFFNH